MSDKKLTWLLDGDTWTARSLSLPAATFRVRPACIEATNKAGGMDLVTVYKIDRSSPALLDEDSKDADQVFATAAEARAECQLIEDDEAELDVSATGHAAIDAAAAEPVSNLKSQMPAEPAAGAGQ